MFDYLATGMANNIITDSQINIRTRIAISMLFFY